jgi:hypothetical protein
MKLEQDKQITKSILNHVFISDITDIITYLAFEPRTLFYGTTTFYTETIHLLEINVYGKNIKMIWWHDEYIHTFFPTGSIPLNVILSPWYFEYHSAYYLEGIPCSSEYFEITKLKSFPYKHYSCIYEMSRIEIDFNSYFNSVCCYRFKKIWEKRLRAYYP